MKKLMAVVLGVGLLVLASGCKGEEEMPKGDIATYTQIDAGEAKRMMDEMEDEIVLDVRTQAEYDEGHIPGAVLVPNETIGTEEPEELPDKEQLILVYCRSGNRSKQAAQKLADLGYTNVYEFGGISSWPYEIE